MSPFYSDCSQSLLTEWSRLLERFAKDLWELARAVSPEGKCTSTSHAKGICSVHFLWRVKEQARWSKTFTTAPALCTGETLGRQITFQPCSVHPWTAWVALVAVSTLMPTTSASFWEFAAPNTCGKATHRRSQATSAVTLSRSSSVWDEYCSSDPNNFVILYFSKWLSCL